MNIKSAKGKILLGIILVTIMGGGYWWNQNSKITKGEIRYVSAKAEKGQFSISVDGSGQVEAVSQVDMKPVIAGDAIDVVRVYVKNDQEVKKGDLLVLLDSEDAQKAVRNAQLDLESAQNKYKQVKDEDVSDKYDKKAQKIAVEQKENALSDARRKMSDYYIRAPFDGIVTGLNVEAGDSVSRSDVLASVITRDVHAVVSLNEVDAVAVRLGHQAILKFDALPELKIKGIVSKIDTIGTVTQGVVTYDAEIAFESQEELLKPGMNVSASVMTETKEDALMVPNSAVKTEGEKAYVEVLAGRTLEKRHVEIGSESNANTEILSGLVVGEKVVIQTIDPMAKATATGGQAGGGFRVPGLGGGGR